VPQRLQQVSAELGWLKLDVGISLIRSGAAMGSRPGHEAWRIMSAGRQQSQAFLVYIFANKFKNFSKGVSERMTANPDFTIVHTLNAETGENPHVPCKYFRWEHKHALSLHLRSIRDEEYQSFRRFENGVRSSTC
jgi:hypothetical protein